MEVRTQQLKDYHLLSWPMFVFFCLSFLYKFFQNNTYQNGNYVLLALLIMAFFSLRQFRVISLCETETNRIHSSEAIWAILCCAGFVFIMLKSNANLVEKSYIDAHIQHIDYRLVGPTMSAWLNNSISPWHTHIASLFYLSFFVYLILFQDQFSSFWYFFNKKQK